MQHTTGWLILAAAVAFNVIGNLLVKKFSMTSAMDSLPAFLSPSFVIGTAAFALGLVLYTRALRDIPIVIAYPVQVGACVLAVALFATTVFGETFGFQHLLGVLLILGGILVLFRLA